MEVRSASMGTTGTHKGRNSVGLVPAAAQQAGLRSASVPGWSSRRKRLGEPRSAAGSGSCTGGRSDPPE